MKIRNTTIENFNYNFFETCYHLKEYNNISSFKKYSIIFGLKHGLILKNNKKSQRKIKDLNFILNFFELSDNEIYNRKLLRYINKNFDGSSFYNQFINLNSKKIKDDVINQVFLFLNFLKKNIFNISGIKLSQIILKNKSNHFKMMRPRFEGLYCDFLIQDGQYIKTIEFISSLNKTSYPKKIKENLDITLGQSYGELGKYKKAIITFENIFQKLKNNKNLNYVKAGIELALLYLKEGEFKKSKKLILNLLDLSQKRFSDSDELYVLQNTLAKYYGEIGNYNNSIKIYKELEPQVKIKFGEHSPFYIQVLGNLGSLNSTTGNFKEALNIKKKTLNMREKVFGKFHLLTIFERQDLFVNYCNLNKIKQAEKLFNENNKVVKLKDIEKELNIRHLLNKVQLLYSKKKYSELEILFSKFKILTFIKTKFNHTYVCQILNFLVVSLMENKNFKKCLKVINIIWPFFVRFYDHKSDLFSQTVFNKIYCLVELNKLNEGLKYINDILKKFKINEKNNSVFFMGLIDQRAMIYEKLSLFNEACRDLEKHLYLYEKNNGIDENYYIYIYNLAQSYKQAELHKKAIQHFEIEFNYLQNKFLPDHEEVKESLSNLDQYLFDQKMHSKAIEHLKTQIKKIKQKDIQLSMRYRVRCVDHYEENEDFKNISKELKVILKYCVSKMGVEHQATLTNSYKFCFYMFKLNQFNSCKNFSLRQYKVYTKHYVNDELSLKGPLLQLLGKVYSELGLYKKSLIYFKECIKHEENCYQKSKDPDALISIYSDTIKYLKDDNLILIHEIKNKLEKIQSSN